MTKDVLITISGIQMIDEEDSDVEMIVRGDYYQKNGKHYILYEEMMEGFTGKVKNVIKISPSGMDIIKKGIANTHMQFEKNKKNLSCYTTPLGDMVVGIQASRIKINEEPDSSRNCKRSLWTVWRCGKIRRGRICRHCKI